MSDLTSGVNAGVRASRAGYPRFFAYFRKSRLYGVLHANASGLGLPSGKRGAVV
jgi:hypothetical protein